MNDFLAPMRVKFLARCEEDLALMRDGADTAEMIAMVHRLAGAAGIFGFSDLGALALRIEDHARATGDIDKAELAVLEQALRDVCLSGEQT